MSKWKLIFEQKKVSELEYQQKYGPVLSTASKQTSSMKRNWTTQEFKDFSDILATMKQLIFYQPKILELTQRTLRTKASLLHMFKPDTIRNLADITSG